MLECLKSSTASVSFPAKRQQIMTQILGVPASHLGDPGGVTAFWLQPGPVSDVAGHLENEPVDERSLTH